MTDAMRTLVFDVETNGLRMRNAQAHQEPAIIQIAGMLFLGRRPVAHLSCFVLPLNHDRTPATIPDEPFFRQAGLTNDVLAAVGRPLKTALAEFQQLVRASDRIVYHNALFDDPVLRANFLRVAAPQQEYLARPKYCTMQTLTPVMKLPGKRGYKYPSLDEAFRALVEPTGFTGAHDAMVDVDATAQVLFAIEDAGHDLWELK